MRAQYETELLKPPTKLGVNPWSPNSRWMWRWIALGFAVDWAAFAAGSLTYHAAVGSMGSIALIAMLGWAACERLWVRLDSVFLLSILIASFPLLNPSDTLSRGVAGLIKHASLWLVIAIASMLRIPAVTESGIRKWLALPLIVIVIMSVAVHRASDWDGSVRQSGLFLNPNNFALMSFLFPLLIDNRRDPLLVRLGVHGVVFGVLLITGTTGAGAAYALGFALFVIRSATSGGRRPWLAPVLAIGGVLGAGIGFWGAQSWLSESRLVMQAKVVQSQLHDLINGDDIYFGDQAQLTGQGSTSALWRLMHWRDAVRLYNDGTFMQHLFGYGVGSSEPMLGLLPHNEYLRVLLEQGLFGFILVLYVWGRMIRRAPMDVQWVGIAFAIYSFSENNLDNFPVMSMLVICLAAGARQSQPATAGRFEPARTVLTPRMRSHAGYIS